MKKIRQGTKKPVVWRATCDECGSVFEEEVKKLNVTSDQRDGDFVRSKCPDCKSEMFFSPPRDRRGSSQFEDH
jgi:predicted Zn-ribbon and HTH transcriptional regulator